MMGGERVRLGGGETHALGAAHKIRSAGKGPHPMQGAAGGPPLSGALGARCCGAGSVGQAGACIGACHSRQAGNAVQRWLAGQAAVPRAEAALPQLYGLTTWSTQGRAASCGCCREGEERAGGGRAAVCQAPSGGGKCTGRRMGHKPTHPLARHARGAPGLPVAGGAVCRGRGGSGAVE